MPYTPEPPVINGNLGVFKQPGSSFGRNESGFFWRYRLKGTKDEVEAAAALYDAAGAAWEVTHMNGGVCEFTASMSTSDGSSSGGAIEDVWELNPQEVQKDLLESDFPFASTYGGGGNVLNAAISAADKLLIMDALEVDRPDQDSLDNGYFDGADNPLDCETLYHLMRKGVKYFPVDADVIRHTRVVSNIYAVKASFTNCGRIFSSASLISLEGVPSTLLFDVPTLPSVSQFIENSGDLQYGWRKPKPSVTQTNYTKWQIQNTYHLGLWTIKTFGAVL